MLPRTRGAMRIAYLVNQYPKVSHSFIRREIAALERQGLAIDRFSLRRTDELLADDADRAELGRTSVVLDAGAVGLARSLVASAAKRPRRLLRAAVRAARLGVRSDRGLLRHAIYLAEACALLEELQALGCDHVHAHFGTNSATVALLCRDLGGPTFSFTAHGPEEFDKPDLIGLSEKIAHAAFVVGVSSFGRSQLYRRCRAGEWRKVEVVRCGVDQSYFEQDPTPVPSAPRIVCVGRLCEQKGQILLVEALASLTHKGVEAELVLVGDGEMRGEIEATVARHGLGRRVRITGWASGDVVRREIVEARAMVLPSFAEGLPVVIMEALALGRPVVSTFVAGIPELVTPGECGWLVPAGSAEALEAAVREVLEASPVLLTRMGAEGRRRVARMHDIEVSARRLGELFAKAGG